MQHEPPRAVKSVMKTARRIFGRAPHRLSPEQIKLLSRLRLELIKRQKGKVPISVGREQIIHKQIIAKPKHPDSHKQFLIAELERYNCYSWQS